LEVVEMTLDENHPPVHISIFGSLRIFMDEQGAPYTLEKEIEPEGMAAYDIARDLNIPPDKIEAVFCNGRIRNIYDTVLPGDRVAFFPHGTPGPYRFFLGMIRENRKRAQREKGIAETGGASESGKTDQDR
jgi:hypothetical protein